MNPFFLWEWGGGGVDVDHNDAHQHTAKYAVK